VTRARNVVHQLLEDGPEDINPKGFIEQYSNEMQPEVFMRSVLTSGYGLFEGMVRLGLIQPLRKKYDDDAIAEAVMLIALERSPHAKTRKVFLELKRLAEFQI
jgi:hypothetical protein